MEEYRGIQGECKGNARGMQGECRGIPKRGLSSCIVYYLHITAQYSRVVKIYPKIATGPSEFLSFRLSLARDEAHKQAHADVGSVVKTQRQWKKHSREKPKLHETYGRNSSQNAPCIFQHWLGEVGGGGGLERKIFF